MKIVAGCKHVCFRSLLEPVRVATRETVEGFGTSTLASFLSA